MTVHNVSALHRQVASAPAQQKRTSFWAERVAELVEEMEWIGEETDPVVIAKRIGYEGKPSSLARRLYRFGYKELGRKLYRYDYRPKPSVRGRNESDLGRRYCRECHRRCRKHNEPRVVWTGKLRIVA